MKMPSKVPLLHCGSFTIALARHGWWVVAVGALAQGTPEQRGVTGQGAHRCPLCFSLFSRPELLAEGVKEPASDSPAAKGRLRDARQPGR